GGRGGARRGPAASGRPGRARRHERSECQHQTRLGCWRARLVPSCARPCRAIIVSRDRAGGRGPASSGLASSHRRCGHPAGGRLAGAAQVRWLHVRSAPGWNRRAWNRGDCAMNHRLTIAAAAAVILASVSEFSLINGAAWYVQACGAVLVVALSGTLTRLGPIPAAVGASVLTAIASVPMLAAGSPVLKATGVGLVLLCAASASGLRPLRAVAGLATYLAALLLYLNLLHAAGQSFFALIPTPRSVHHLATLASQGASASRFSPPVPASHGVILLAAGSIGLAAIAVDFLAVRMRRPAIAGL